MVLKIVNSINQQPPLPIKKSNPLPLPILATHPRRSKIATTITHWAKTIFLPSAKKKNPKSRKLATHTARSDPQEVSAAINFNHQLCLYHINDFWFHRTGPRWRWRWSSLQIAIYSPTPIDARSSPSTCELNPCQCCTAKSLSPCAPLIPTNLNSHRSQPISL